MHEGWENKILDLEEGFGLTHTLILNTMLQQRCIICYIISLGNQLNTQKKRPPVLLQVTPVINYYNSLHTCYYNTLPNSKAQTNKTIEPLATISA